MVADAFAAVFRRERDIDVVEVAATVAGGLEAAGHHRPDVVLTDLCLPDGVITDHLRDLLLASPGSGVLVVTGAPTEKALLDALDGGARGFVDKGGPVGDLVDAVRRIAIGELVVSPALAPMLLSHLADGPGRSRDALTRRELAVLQLLARGRSTASIAADLHLSANTVRNHIANLMPKLRTHSRLEAVSEATRRGLISPF